MQGYQTPAGAGAVNAAVYSYRAESADLTQWEVGFGAYTVAGTVLARTTVLFNSLGTTAKVNFTVAPQVAVVALAEDLVRSIAGNAGAFTLGIGLTNATNDLRVSLATASNVLGADVATNASTYADGPSMAQGTSGTWLVSGSVTLGDSAGAATFQIRLWDGTTVIDSGTNSISATTSGNVVSLSGIITSPAANIRISVKGSTATGKILFNTSGNSKDSSIFGIRIA